MRILKDEFTIISDSPHEKDTTAKFWQNRLRAKGISPLFTVER